MLDHLHTCDLLILSRVSHAIRNAVLTFKPGKPLDLSILPPKKRHSFNTAVALTDTLKQLIANHEGLDVSGTLITVSDLDTLIQLNPTWISIARCVAITNRASTINRRAIGVFISVVMKNPQITTDMYLLDVRMPLDLGSIGDLRKCNDRARVFTHACRGDYIDVTFTLEKHVDEKTSCHQCGSSTCMYRSCGLCGLCLCDDCRISKCKCERDTDGELPDTHGEFCAGCASVQNCTLCQSFPCWWDKIDDARLMTCVICGLRSCTTCTPSSYTCNKCRFQYCGQCFERGENELCGWKCT